MPEIELIFINVNPRGTLHQVSMKAMIRPLLILLTLLSLISYTPALAAGAAGMTPMVICGSNGAETVWLDATGTPAETPEDCSNCLDCIAFSDVFLPPPVAGAAIPLHPAIMAPIFFQETRTDCCRLRPMPRAPPEGGANGRPMCRDMTDSVLARVAPAVVENNQAQHGQSATGRRANT